MKDPTNAIICVDQLSRIVIRCAMRQPPDDLMFDPAGVIRVNLRGIQFPRQLGTAFEQICMFAETDLVVSLRLLRLQHDEARAPSFWMDRRPTLY